MLHDDGGGEKKGREARKLIALRVPVSLHEYVVKRSNGRHGGLTRVLEDALQLHRKLFDRLEKHKLRIQRFALDEGLDWPNDEAEIYSRLITRALDDADRARRK